MDIFKPKEQRPALLALAGVIDSRSSSLRRDACSDWVIHGTKGAIFADGPRSFLFLVRRHTEQAWSFAKRSLSFAELQQDGDTEGSFRLDGRMPTQSEAATIRRVLGIAKRKLLSEDHIRKLREGLLRAEAEQNYRPRAIDRDDHTRQPVVAEIHA